MLSVVGVAIRILVTADAHRTILTYNSPSHRGSGAILINYTEGGNSEHIDSVSKLVGANETLVGGCAMPYNLVLHTQHGRGVPEMEHPTSYQG